MTKTILEVNNMLGLHLLVQVCYENILFNYFLSFVWVKLHFRMDFVNSLMAFFDELLNCFVIFWHFVLGIMYSFLGISLITQNYINPAIDTIKKKGIIKPDTMNATLLAFSNSAAESFIVINSIFFGVSDIGI